MKPSTTMRVVLTLLATRNWTLHKFDGIDSYECECCGHMTRRKPPTHKMVASLARETERNFPVTKATISALIKRGWVEIGDYPTTYRISRAGCLAIGVEYVDYWWMTDPTQRARFRATYGPSK